MTDIKLCVNIDHVATLREARKGLYPDPCEAAVIAEKSGAHGITVHLREDRRHINESDVLKLKEIVKGKYNLEMALSDEIIGIALRLCPDQVTIVPENRLEVTTEGGLDVKNNYLRVKQSIERFKSAGIIVSLFIEPDIESVSLSKDAGADYIEFHTGKYAGSQEDFELKRLFTAAEHAVQTGIRINAGHGLNRGNLLPLLDMPGLEELNIGHSIVSRAVFVGLESAVRELLNIIGTKK
jgi:pyridoxine 5-phosphate synthase